MKFSPKEVLPTRGARLNEGSIYWLRRHDYWFPVQVLEVGNNLLTYDGNHRFMVAEEQGKSIDGLLILPGDEEYMKMVKELPEFRNYAIDEGYLTYNHLLKLYYKGQ